MSRHRLRKCYAVVIIAGVLALQGWVIIPLRYQQAWYWPFMNYPMYSAAHYPGEQFIKYELWAGPAGEPEQLRLISHRELHLTTFAYAKALRTAQGRDGPMVWGRDESASDFLARLVAGIMPNQPLRLQIWTHTWTLTERGLEDRIGVRELERDWSPTCGPGPAGLRCAGEIP